MRIFKTMAVASASLLAASTASALSITIDDFTTEGFVQSNLQGNPATSTAVGAGIIGGERYMWVSSDNTAPKNATSLEVTAGGGEVSFSNATNSGTDPVIITTGQAVLVYDGVGGVATPQDFVFNDVPTSVALDGKTAKIPVVTDGLGGVDFLGGGKFTPNQVFFDFGVGSFDVGGIVEFAAYAWDTMGGFAEYTETLANPGPGLDNISFDTTLKLSEFGGAIDWSKVGALAFSVESLTGEFDGSLTAITVVPLPASALLLLGGLGGLFGASSLVGRRRRNV